MLCVFGLLSWLAANFVALLAENEFIPHAFDVVI